MNGQNLNIDRNDATFHGVSFGNAVPSCLAGAVAVAMPLAGMARGFTTFLLRFHSVESPEIFGFLEI